MADLKVVSREYKAMLKASRFAGDEGRLLETAGRFWRAAGEAFAGVVVDVGGDLSKIQAHRLIRFYDTPKRELNANAYIFRERADVDGKLREVTLKFRHPDRYLAQDCDLRAAEGADARTKFEEDIKPPFQSMFSHSTTQRIAPTKTLDTLKDVSRFYPGDQAGARTPREGHPDRGGGQVHRARTGHWRRCDAARQVAQDRRRMRSGRLV